MAIVKTSLTLDDKLVEETKKLAFAEDISWSKWINRLMRDAVTKDKKRKRRIARKAVK